MGPLKSTYTYIKVCILSNKITGLCRLVSLPFFETKDKIYEPAYDGNDGNKVPDDFDFY